MKRRKPTLKQPTSTEMVDQVLGIIGSKFYQGHPVNFTKDCKRLIAWVVLYPATWLNERAVTLPPARYVEIMRTILIDAAANGNLGKVKYLPAWLRQTVQSHFAMHGDEYYDEAKCMRNLVDNALIVAGQAVAKQPDPVRDLALAKHLTTARQRPKKRAVNGQLTFL